MTRVLPTHHYKVVFTSLLTLGLTACSSAPKDPVVAEEPKPAITAETINPSAEATPVKNAALTQEQLQQRVLDLEMRIAALNDKINLLGSATPPKAESKFEKDLPTKVVQTHVAAAKTVPAATVVQNEVTDRYREAKILFDSKRYADANMEFSEFLKAFPQHPYASMAQFYVGQCYFELKEYTLAEEEWNQGLLNYSQSQAVVDYYLGIKRIAVNTKNQKKLAYIEQKLKALFEKKPFLVSDGKTTEKTPVIVSTEENTQEKLEAKPEIKTEELKLQPAGESE